MTSYHQVNSVKRALALIEIMNRQQYSSIGHLHTVSGIPKPTIIRLLETLSACGYVTKDTSNKGYRITSAVNALSFGYHGAPVVAEAGRPWAQKLTQLYRWPTAIATLSENEMLVSYTTSADSPVSPYHSIQYKKVGVTTHALGRAYFAFCPDDEREILLRVQHEKAGSGAPSQEEREAMDALVAEIREQGFAERDPGVEAAQTSSIAVPIPDLCSDRVLGSLALTYYRSAVTKATIVQVYVPAMKLAAKGIAKSVKALQERQRMVDTTLAVKVPEMPAGEQ
jgi:IclR family mhp operon transcriptional activator